MSVSGSYMHQDHTTQKFKKYSHVYRRTDIEFNKSYKQLTHLPSHKRKESERIHQESANGLEDESVTMA